MIKNTYPDMASRRIKVEGTADEIELVGKLSADKTTVLFKLYINKSLCDHIEFRPLVEDVKALGYLYGLQPRLNGLLREDVMINVECKPADYAMPEYLFYVQDQLVHKEFGDKGGL